MILALLVLVPIAGGLLAWAAAPLGPRWPRWISLAALALDFALALATWIGRPAAAAGAWIAEIDRPWIAPLGIHLHLAMDGLSLLLVLLTGFLGLASVLCSWTEIRERVGFFHLNLMWVLSGVIGVFLAMDLFLFYFAWELMLVPMFLLIVIWGHERRVRAGIKFFLFTQLSGLLMLVAILALVFAHRHATGVLSFQYGDLLGTPLGPAMAAWTMLGFFVAFAVKLPMVPFHPWLPDAHTEAPTAGSVILAGLLLKTGGYGMLRFVVPLFPGAAHAFAPLFMALGAAGILYGALLAFGQTDLKRLVAYTSVSHLGFVLLGIFAWDRFALQGAVVEMICHGLSTGALFIVVGALQERLHTREMDRMGGLWDSVPRMSGVAMVLAMASLGLPGLGNFVGEFLVLLGTFRVSVPLAAVGTIGVLVGTFYALRLVQRVFHGPAASGTRIADLSAREALVMAAMIAGLVGLGLWPQPVLDTFRPAMDGLQRHAAAAFALPPEARP